MPKHSRASRDRPRITSGREWHETVRRGEIIELPSGATVRLRRLSVADVLCLGYIPDVISPAVTKAVIYGNTSAYSDWGPQEFYELWGAICRGTFVEPRIVDNPQADDEIALSDVGTSDRVAVYQWAAGEARLFRKFPERESGGDVAVVSDGEAVREQAEPDSGVS